MERVRLALALAMVRARKAKGLSQAELAERLGVSQSWVSKLENPDIAHTFESILEYLQAVGAVLDMEIPAGSEQLIVSRAQPATTAAAPRMTCLHSSLMLLPQRRRGSNSMVPCHLEVHNQMTHNE